MQKWILTLAATATGFAVTVPAQAMPFPSVSEARPGVTLIAQGCGPGWYRGPYGRCHPMGYAPPAPYYRPYPYVHPYPHCWWANGVRVCR
jgi:hypothetical protein